jgi:triphosphoribosyl-dephospho-CoA synthase
MRSVESAVRTACIWEATARKAGNVYPGKGFPGLSYGDFVRSADAIAPVLQRMTNAPLGVTILEAVRATRAVVATNTNLGIVLLLTPLTRCRPSAWSTQLQSILSASTIGDAKHVYQAIRLAVPGGMGKVENQDIACEPTQTLSEVMATAADRDLIARQYANGFADVLTEGVPTLMRCWEQFGRIEAAILSCQLHWLSQFPDSLIARKCGPDLAAEVMRRARAIDLATVVGRRRYADLDVWLRGDGHARNPGTTADLVTACLFVALCDGRMNEDLPFTWEEY